MRWPVALFLGWLVLGIDAGLSIHLSPGGGEGLRVAPSFTIPFLVYIALSAPMLPTMWTALLLGLMADLTSVRGDPAIATIGPHVFGYLAAAYLVQTLRGVMMRKSLVALIVLSIPAKLLASVVAIAIMTVRSMYTNGLGAGVEFHPLPEMGRALLSALVTGFSAALLGLALIPMHGLFHFRDANSRRYVPRSR